MTDPVDLPRWDDKVPGESTQVFLDFTLDLPPGVVLTNPVSASVAPNDGSLVLGAAGIANDPRGVPVYAAVEVSGGVPGFEYIVTITVTRSDGATVPRSAVLPITQYL